MKYDRWYPPVWIGLQTPQKSPDKILCKMPNVQHYSSCFWLTQWNPEAAHHASSFWVLLFPLSVSVMPVCCCFLADSDSCSFLLLCNHLNGPILGYTDWPDWQNHRRGPQAICSASELKSLQIWFHPKCKIITLDGRISSVFLARFIPLHLAVGCVQTHQYCGGHCDRRFLLTAALLLMTLLEHLWLYQISKESNRV